MFGKREVREKLINEVHRLKEVLGSVFRWTLDSMGPSAGVVGAVGAVEVVGQKDTSF